MAAFKQHPKGSLAGSTGFTRARDVCLSTLSGHRDETRPRSRRPSSTARDSANLHRPLPSFATFLPASVRRFSIASLISTCRTGWPIAASNLKFNGTKVVVRKAGSWTWIMTTSASREDLSDLLVQNSLGGSLPNRHRQHMLSAGSTS